MKRRMMLVICSQLVVLPVLSDTAGQSGRERIEVQYIGDVSTSSGVVDVDAAEPMRIDGVLEAVQTTAARTVHVIVRRKYDGHEVVVGTAVVVQASRRGSSRAWGIPPVRLPLPEFGRGWEIYAIVVDGELPQGSIDAGTIRRVARATSEPIVARAVGAEPSVPAEARCAIDISDVRDVYGQRVSATTREIEVGLMTEITGVIDYPRGAASYVVVRPSSSERVWVMSPVPPGLRSFRAFGYFGRPGLDVGETYVVNAYLFPEPIEANRSYDAEVWRLIERRACASSADVIVRRRVGPGDLRITRIDRQSVGDEGPMEVNAEPTIEGDIEDPQPLHALNRAETVWLLTRLVGSEGWRVTALAIVQPDRLSWRAPAVRFIEPGNHHIMAVAATTRLAMGRILSPEEWYELARRDLVRRLSRNVVVRPIRSSSEELQ